jgi:hypothetical protein
MGTGIAASRLRQDIYRLLDQVLETGEPLEIRRKGHTLRIVSESRPGAKLSALRRHSCLTGDPESIVHMDWSRFWNKGKGLL